jgi:hypothetical protein
VFGRLDGRAADVSRTRCTVTRASDTWRLCSHGLPLAYPSWSLKVWVPSRSRTLVTPTCGWNKVLLASDLRRRASRTGVGAHAGRDWPASAATSRRNPYYPVVGNPMA